MAIPFPSSEAYRELPWNKRIDLVAKLYMVKCTTSEVFIGKKMNPKYFAIRKFFIDRLNDTNMFTMWDFLISLSDRTPMALTIVFGRMEEYRKKLISFGEKQKVQELQVEQYREFNLDDIMNL